jgi:O-antigen/teichoic acid export membrane protein
MPFYKNIPVRDKNQYRSLLGFSIWPWMQSIIVVLTFQTDRFWVSSYAGLTEVSGYGLVSTMFNHIHIIFTAMAVWMLPRMAAMASRGDDPSRLYEKVRGGLLSIVIPSMLCLYFISGPLFRLWTGAETYSRIEAYLGCFIAFEIVFAHSIMPIFYLNASGMERRATGATLLYCGICYICMLGGLWIFHTPAAMVGGMTLAMCLSMPVINMMVQKCMQGRYSWEKALFEMLPVYTAVLMVYLQNSWATGILGVLLAFSLWKFYSSKIFNRNTWKQPVTHP